MVSSTAGKGLWVDRAFRMASYVIGAVVLALLVGVLTAGPARATTFTVNSTAHPGTSGCNATECTLAEAVQAANFNGQNDIITFASGLKGDIPLHNTASQGGFSIYDDVSGADLTINGPGAKVLAVNGNDETRAFGIASPANVTIRGLAIKNGKSYSSDPDAGGIGNSGTLTLDEVIVSGNTAYGGGGGIYNTGTLAVTDSTFSGNSANTGGGTFDNSYSGYSTTLTNSTISGNNGGGIVNSPFGTTYLRNSIVAGNLNGPDAQGNFNSQGTNLIGNISGSSGWLGSDLLNRDPLLGPPQNNGGPTNTRALLPGSPAIDAATNTGCPITDQRAVARKDGDKNGTVVCDIGAYERSDFKAPSVSSTTPTSGATGVKRGANLTATFSEKMTRSTLNTSTFKLYKVNSNGSTTQITNVSVSTSIDGLKATLNPFGTSSTLLLANTTYKAVVTTGTRDLAGNQLDQSSTTSGKQQKSWTFKTGSG